MAKSKIKRSVVVVDRGLQLGIALRVIGWLGYYLVLFCVLAVGGPLLLRTLSSGNEFSLEQAVTELMTFGERLLAPILLTSLCLILHCLSLLNRVAGPVYRLRRNLDELGEGNLESEMSLRPGDFLQDVASTYNDSLSSLRSEVRWLKEEIGKLNEDVFELSRSSEFEGEGLDSIRSRVKGLTQQLEHFSLPTAAVGAREKLTLTDEEQVEQPEELEAELP